ncbi:hypothetical protein PMIN07_007346 [Paraphaeosphaeria minitans]
MASEPDLDYGHQERTMQQSESLLQWGQIQDSNMDMEKGLLPIDWTHGMIHDDLDEDSESIGTTYGSPSDCGAVSGSRPYTSSFGPPVFQSEQSDTSTLSIITDAGDQQHQKHLALPSTKTDFDGLEDDEFSDSDERYGSKHKLQSAILEALEARTVNGTRDTAMFLPKGKLYHLINIETVKHELAENLPGYSVDLIVDYAEAVCVPEKVYLDSGREQLKSYRKIFALLVLAGLTESIIDFVRDNVSDLCLPVMNISENAGKPVLYRMNSHGKPFGKRLRCFHGSKWQPMNLHHFEKQQWIFLAPYFSQSKHDRANHYVLQAQHILPFISSDTPIDDTEHYGGFAKVFTVRLHPNHHNFPDKVLCNRGFAIKQLITNDRNVFKKEVKILKKFSGAHSHPHVVSLLATYEQEKTFHLIFYKADGDLFNYWRRTNRNPILNHKNVLWILKQWIGITEGLGRLHRHLTLTFSESHPHEEPAVCVSTAVPLPQRSRSDSVQSNGARILPASPTWADNAHAWDSGELERPTHGKLIEEPRFGRHGDISPGNILWYDNDDKLDSALRGTLKLSDFGEAELNSAFSRTRKGDVAATMTYRAPECDFPPKHIRQSYDIWSLGCVFLEFVTWLLDGADALDAFAEQRLSRDPFPPHEKNDIFFDAEKNPEFDFEKNPEFGEIRPKVKGKVVQFISILHENPKCSEFLHDMLNLIEKDMLLVDQEQRFCCVRVVNKLEDMRGKCFNNYEYAVTGHPWCVYKRTPRRVTAIGRSEASNRTSIQRHRFGDQKY